jgi:hypothetical protein
MRSFVADADSREARYARGRAHDIFDRLWVTDRHGRGFMSRNEAYNFLAKLFRVEEIHIADMNVEQCEQVIKACKQLFGEE